MVIKNIIKILSIVLFSTNLFSMNIEKAIENLLKNAGNKELSINVAKYLDSSLLDSEKNKLKQALIGEILKNKKAVDLLGGEICKISYQNFMADSAVKNVTFSPNGKFLIINTDKNFDLYDISESKVKHLQKFNDKAFQSIDSVSFSSDSKFFLTLINRSQPILIVWDLDQFNRLDVQSPSLKLVNNIRANASNAGFLADKKIILVNRGCLSLFEFSEKEKAFMASQFHDLSSSNAADNRRFSSIGSNMAFVGFIANHSLLFAQVKDEAFVVKESPTYMSKFVDTYLTSFSPDSKYLITANSANDNKYIMINETTNDFQIFCIFGINEKINSISVHKSNDFIALGALNKVLLYDIADKNYWCKISQIDVAGTGVGVFSPDGKYLAISSGNMVTMYDWLKYRLNLLNISDLLLIKYLAETDDFNKLLENPLFRGNFIPSVNKSLMAYFARELYDRYLGVVDISNIIQSYL